MKKAQVLGVYYPEFRQLLEMLSEVNQKILMNEYGIEIILMGEVYPSFSFFHKLIENGVSEQCLDYIKRQFPDLFREDNIKSMKRKSLTIHNENHVLNMEFVSLGNDLIIFSYSFEQVDDSTTLEEVIKNKFGEDVNIYIVEGANVWEN